MADPVIPRTLLELYETFAPDSMDEAIRNPRRELIGTMFYMYQQAIDTSAAAQAQVAAMQTTLNNSPIPRALLTASRLNSSLDFTLNRANGIASITKAADYVQFNFSAPMSNVAYGVVYGFTGNSDAPLIAPASVTKNVSYVRFTFASTTAGGTTTHVLDTVMKANLLVL